MTRLISYTTVLFALSMGVSVQRIAGQKIPSDSSATRETVNLFNHLRKISGKGFLFGHQDDLAYGVEWKYEPGRSDIKDVTGDYPALYGWELGGIEDGRDRNLDGVPFDQMRKFIQEGYRRGGAITISWHAGSPSGAPKGAWDTTHGTVASVIPGGAHHELYKRWLDRVASFISSLKGPKGEAIPVFFRPFHELTGTWFWWCRNACSPEEYRALWRFTFVYMTKGKGLHNLLWVYNTAGNFNSGEEFMERYPGDDVVDVVSFDAYQSGDPLTDRAFEEGVNRRLEMIGGIAVQRNKLFALAETGYEAIPYEKWWTGTLMSAIGDCRIAWVLLWRNHGYQPESGKMHYYAPYRGQLSVNDFIRFYRDKRTLFGKDIEKKKIYR